MTGADLEKACKELGWDYTKMSRYVGIARQTMLNYRRDVYPIPKAIAFMINRTVEDMKEP